MWPGTVLAQAVGEYEPLHHLQSSHRVLREATDEMEKATGKEVFAAASVTRLGAKRNGGRKVPARLSSTALPGLLTVT